MFEGLNAIPWAELAHAYGSAEEVPMWLRQLASNDEQIRHAAISRLGGSLEHQGGLCPATAYVVPYLIALLQEPTIQEKYEILGWLGVFFRAMPLDKKTWYGADDAESYGPWGTMPASIPYKDTHATIEAAIPVYITLLDAPVLIDRLEAAHLLMRFSERPLELWSVLQAALEREKTEPGRADLILELGRLAKRLPEKRAFFLERFQTEQSELCRFAAALVAARMAKEETPEDVAQLLIRVMFQAPPSLDVYLRLPCGERYPWSAALWALSNLGPARLKSLLPMLAEHLHQIRDRYVLEIELFARLTLFIAFEEPPEQEHAPRPAEAFTEQQRNILLALLEQDQLWHEGNFLGMLKAYGLPGICKDMAGYLGQEPLAETPSPWKHLANPPNRDHPGRYREVIMAAYPDLFISSIGGRVLNETIQEEDVVEVNNSLLFRFPTQADAVEAMERETALLRLLQDRVPLPIPKPTYVSQGTREIGRFFIGYTRLPGKSFSQGLLECVDGDEKVQRLAEQLASFLHALHHVPVTQLAHLSLPEAPKRKALEALYLRAREELFDQLPPERQTQITARFEAFLDQPENFAVTPVLVHSNFGPETILYYAKECRISGIINFSGACLGDPAIDFAHLVGPEGYSQDFLQRWVPIYPELPSLLERAHFYAEVFALEGEFRKRREQESKASTSLQFPEIDRLFHERPRLRPGDEETPIGGNFSWW